MKKVWMRKALALVLCCVMLCAVGCTPSDDTAATTTTTQEIVTTTTTVGDVDTDDTTTTVEDVTTTVDDANTNDTTTKNDVVTTTKDGVVTTSTTKNGTTKDNGKVTTTTTKKPTTSTTKRNTVTTTKPVQTGPKVITCYGDSVTEGMGVGPNKTTTATKGLPYPGVLQELLGSDYKVQNAGDGGEKTQSIMARQGSLKLYTKKEVNYLKNQSTFLLDSGAGRGVITSNGLDVQWTDPFGRDAKIDKVTINGKSYKLQFANFDWGNCQCETYLIRENTKKPETIPAGSEVILEISQISKTNYCDIYFMGFNGTWKTVDELIAQYQQMVDYRNDDNYLVVIPFWNKNDKTASEAYTKFKAAFGDHALDLVQYCVDGGIVDLGLEVTNEDQECLNNNILPYSLKLYGSDNKSDVHLSAKGYKVLANALHEQGKKINLW